MVLQRRGVDGIREVQAAGNVSHLITLHSFGDMPRDDVECSMRLFAKEVLPVVKQIPADQSEAVPFAQWQQATTVPA